MAPKRSQALQILSDRKFLLIWLSTGIVSAGDWAFEIAVTVMMYKMNGKAFDVGKAFFFMLAPYILLQPFAGVVADMINRRLLMIIGGLLSSVLVIVLLFCPNMFWLYIVIMLISSSDAFCEAAQYATIPGIIHPDYRVTANSLMEGMRQVMTIIGPFFTGILLIKMNIKAVFLVDSAIFFLSTLPVLFLTTRKESWTRGSATFRAVMSELREGMAFSFTRPAIRCIMTLFFMTFLGASLTVGLGIVFAEQTLTAKGGEGSLEYSYIVSAIGLGMAIGTIVIARYGKDLSRKKLILAGLLVAAVRPAGFATMKSLWLILPFLIISGLGNSAIGISLETLLQNNVPRNMRGRVFSLASSCMVAAQAVAMGLGGFLADRFGLWPIYAFTTLAFITLGIFASFIPGYKDIEEYSVDLRTQSELCPQIDPTEKPKQFSVF
jgi:MFS family permease